MKRTDDRTAAWDRLERLLADAGQQSYNDETDSYDPELPNPDDVLSIDAERVAKVLLTCGGPTVWIEYRFTDTAGELDYRRADYCTTDTPSGHTARVELSDEEAATLADVYCYGIDMLAETLRGES